MTDTATEKVADLPVQVPVPVSDPLYAEVIGSLERDLEAARDRHHKAEQKVKDLSKINDEVELLRDTIDRMRNELDATKNLVVNMNQYVEAMYKIFNKVYRS
jgi:predicted  nucleic acid-binding Zn-ribbon protein